VLSSRFSRGNKGRWGGALLVEVLLIATACGQIGALAPIITEGQQFAHSVQFPAAFRAPDSAKRPLPLQFDHYSFRVSPMFPDVLLVAACRYVSLAEVCSVNSFAIDTEHGYAVREPSAGEWEEAAPILGEKEMRNPYRRTLKRELAKPVSLQPLPISGRDGGDLGYKYRGREYLRRGDWIVSLNFADSEDGKLIVLAGVDKRRFRNQDPSLVSSAVETGLSGLVTVDVFAADPSHHIAAFDLESHTNVNLARRRISLVNSRWLAVGLDAGLQKILLFDFKSLGSQSK
jgi:hypothetical protein